MILKDGNLYITCEYCDCITVFSEKVVDAYISNALTEFGGKLVVTCFHCEYEQTLDLAQYDKLKKQ